jgi:serine/threonine protein kinase
MDKYETIDFLGEGSFAKVSKAKDLKTGEIVAIKKLKKKYSTWQECVDLREVKSLNKLKQNDNIIKLKEMIRTEDNLYLVFEYMEKNLYELMTEKQTTKKFSEPQIKYILFQTLQGIAYMHKYGFFHRDLKPENLLVNGDKIKIADLGLAREIRSIPPYTDYVSTRYYRAPECILKSTNYNSPVDIWALGCIMAELYNFKPLFYGSSEKEVFFRIASVLGTPTSSTWSEGVLLAKKCDIKFPNCSGVLFSQLVPYADKDAIDLLSEMLRWDPNKRATATNLLQHSFFTKTPIPLHVNLSGKDNFMQDNSVYLNKNEAEKSVKTFTTYNNNNMNTDVKTTLIGKSGNSEISYINKKEEDDISKMLEDTVGFNKCKVFFRF